MDAAVGAAKAGSRMVAAAGEGKGARGRNGGKRRQRPTATSAARVMARDGMRTGGMEDEEWQAEGWEVDCWEGGWGGGEGTGGTGTGEMVGGGVSEPLGGRTRAPMSRPARRVVPPGSKGITVICDSTALSLAAPPLCRPGPLPRLPPPLSLLAPLKSAAAAKAAAAAAVPSTYRRQR